MTTLELPQRRESDHRKLNIEDMIADENDPKQRAFLIVLSSINSSLIANTETVKEVSSKLEAHLTDFKEHKTSEDAILNKGRGMWTVLAWVIGAAQFMGLAIWNDSRNELKETAAAVKAVVAQNLVIESRLKRLEKP